MIDINNFPMLAARQTTPFFADLTSTRHVTFVQGGNNNNINLGVYNMLVSKRDLHLWCKMGMKPNRSWNVTAVKKYFGLKGNKKNLLDQFEALKAEVDEAIASN